MELLITISIVVVLAAVGVVFYLDYAKNIELKTATNTLISDLKQSQSKSMSGVENKRWGIHFVNGDSDYYEIFSSPTDYSDVDKNIILTRFLAKGVSFLDPIPGSSKDIIFNKITGSTIENSTTLGSSNFTKEISVSSIGTITNGAGSL